MTYISKAQAATGAMVALFPDATVAAQLAQPGGEPVDDLHITLAYLGPAANLENGDIDRLKQAVAEFAARTAPISGHISGTGKFTAGPTPVTYASVDLPTLPAARERLIFDLSSVAWLEPSREHGFTPHITLAYDDRPVSVPNLELTFDTVTLVLADERTDYALSGAYAEWVVPLWKAQETDEQIVYGVVLQPGVKDSQGDIVSAAEIEKAAHRWLEESRKHDVQHDETVAPIVPVESFIAPAELEVAGKPVLKGSWVMAARINDPAIWDRVKKGEITGYSIGGSAIRSESAAA
jgi:2'-5' RNA ligase